MAAGRAEGIDGDVGLDLLRTMWRIRAFEERRKLELHVLETQRLESLAMLTGGVAHDFNNLLAVILGNSRIASTDVPPDSPLHLRLARIRAAASPIVRRNSLSDSASRISAAPAAA